MTKLTKRYLDSIHGKDHGKVFERADTNGLSIRVSAKGLIKFQVRYAFDGKPSRMDLGSYPAMPLEDARQSAYAAHEKVKKGINPKVQNDQIKQENLRSLSVEEVFHKWYERICKHQKVGHLEILRSFEIYIFPVIGQYRHDDIDTSQWMNILFEIRDKTPFIAERILNNQRSASEWAQSIGAVKKTPLDRITAVKHLAVTKNTNVGRSLSDEEIKLIWGCNDLSRSALKSKLFIQLLFFYGCRSGELLKASIEDFDFNKKVWAIPPHKHKTGYKTKQPLTRPIIKPFEDTIRYCFELSGTNRLFNTGHKSVLTLPRDIINYSKRHTETPLEPFNLTDIRKTVRTNLSSITDPYTAERCLGHEPPKLFKVYDRYDYLDEMATAYENWYERLSDMVNISSYH